MFRQLNQKEEKEFRVWARKNYVPHTDIPVIWHPVVRDECQRINKEEDYDAAYYRDIGRYGRG